MKKSTLIVKNTVGRSSSVARVCKACASDVPHGHTLPRPLPAAADNALEKGAEPGRHHLSPCRTDRLTSTPVIKRLAWHGASRATSRRPSHGARHRIRGFFAVRASRTHLAPATKVAGASCSRGQLGKQMNLERAVDHKQCDEKGTQSTQNWRDDSPASPANTRTAERPSRHV